MAWRQPVCTQLLLFEGAQHLFSKFSWHLGWGFLRCPEAWKKLEFHNNKVTLFSEHIGVHSKVDTLQKALRKIGSPRTGYRQEGVTSMTDLSPHPGSFGPPFLGHTAAGQAQQGTFSLFPGSSQHKNNFFFFFFFFLRLACGGPKDRKWSIPSVVAKKSACKFLLRCGRWRRSS